MLITNKIILAVMNNYDSEFHDSMLLIAEVTPYGQKELEKYANAALALSKTMNNRTLNVSTAIGNVVSELEWFCIENEPDIMEMFNCDYLVVCQNGSENTYYPNFNIERWNNEAVRMKGYMNLRFWPDGFFFEFQSDNAGTWESNEIMYADIGFDLYE